MGLSDETVRAYATQGHKMRGEIYHRITRAHILTASYLSDGILICQWTLQESQCPACDFMLVIAGHQGEGSVRE